MEEIEALLLVAAWLLLLVALSSHSEVSLSGLSESLVGGGP